MVEDFSEMRKYRSIIVKLGTISKEEILKVKERTDDLKRQNNQPDNRLLLYHNRD